jgi:DNA-binding cell septation regulator SpoVG
MLGGRSKRMSASIEVLAIKPLAKGGNLKAFASVRLGGVVIHDCRVIQQPGQRPWVSLPQREYEQDGQKKYSVIVELNESLKREVSRLVLAEWERGGA